MPSLEKSLRTQLERIVKNAREKAEAGARAVLEQLGVGEANPHDDLSNDERDLRRRLRIHGRQLGDERIGEPTALDAGSSTGPGASAPGSPRKGTQQIDRLVEEVAYEHWHRLLFASFLAENRLLMFPDPDGPVAISLSECDDMAADEGARNGWELAARYATKMLPQIFRVESPVFELQLPPEHQQQLEKLVAELPTSVFTALDSLGWVYQFWQANRKKQINESEVKIGARELPAVTQLFTEDYMVDFLLDNTLGAWHAGKVIASKPDLAQTSNSEDELRQAASLPGCPWTYLRFIREPTALAAGSDESKPAGDTPDASAYGSGLWRPAAGTFDGWPTTAKDLKCLDPCMGSGHFIVAMFERLVALRMAEESLDERAAVMGVIRDNLFGLEIDPRCTQIAAFNLGLAAWRRVGYCVLPLMNLACSGLAPNTSRDEWLELAGDNEKLQGGMERLYDLFEQAPVLGSLINPRTNKNELLEAGFHELQPLLEKALAHEAEDEISHEMAVIARGLAKAAEILAGQFTLVSTNVPYLGRKKHDDVLKNYCERVYPNSKTDLATCFLERSLTFCASNGSITLVTPQNWLSLGGYEELRRNLLKNGQWDFVARLGPKGFQTPMYDFNVLLIGLTNRASADSHSFSGFDVSELRTPTEKNSAIRAQSIVRLNQKIQLANPDSRVSTSEMASGGKALGEYVECYQGVVTGDLERFRIQFWEVDHHADIWRPFRTTTSTTGKFDGLDAALRWEGGKGQLHEYAALTRDQLHDMHESGNRAWSKLGVAINRMAELRVTRYLGEIFDNNVAVAIPKNPSHIPALLAFCSAPGFHDLVRSLDQTLKVTNRTLVKVPFDLPHWQRVAIEKSPDGLPEPFSSDPTQWLFNGHPAGSDQPLQVAVARLVGYQWPRQTGSSFPDCPALGPDGLESHADKDGIVCIPPVRGEASASDRLLNLLASAYGDQWSGDVLGRLLNDAGYAGKGLETWLRDGFFAQHIDIFHKRPFVWHIWDGLRDGFSALVNYHKLDHKNLKMLIYTYLGNWIDRQSKNKSDRVDGAEEKLAAAEQLKKRLELILKGEAPYDIFVRWKPLYQQPIGWEPDINDGVRMNIRPFVSVPDIKVKGAGVLRANPKIKWDKDRGKEPQRLREDFPWFWGWDGKTTDFTGIGTEPSGERFNDCHYTLEAKRKMREIQK